MLKLAEDAKYVNRLMYLDNKGVFLFVICIVVIGFLLYVLIDRAVKKSIEHNVYDYLLYVSLIFLISGAVMLEGKEDRVKDVSKRYDTYVSSLETTESSLEQMNVVSYSIVPRKGKLYADLVVRDEVNGEVTYRTVRAEIRGDLMTEEDSLLTYKKLPVTIKGNGKKGEIDVVLHVKIGSSMGDVRGVFDKKIVTKEL